MLHEPRVLFLDEPTAGVDVRSRGLFWEAIQDEAARGVTVFVTTHFLEEADYCDRVSFIDAGRLVADATPDGAAPALLRRLSDHDRRRRRRSAQRVLSALGDLAARRDGAADGTLGRHRPGARPRRPRSSRRARRRGRPHHRGADDRGLPARAAGSARGMSGRRLWTLVRREVRATFRDPFTVVDPDRRPAGRAAGVQLGDLHRGPRPRPGGARRRPARRRAAGWWPTSPPAAGSRRARSPAQAEIDRGLRGGDVGAALVIPPDFSRDAARGTHAAGGADPLRRRRDGARRQRRGRAARARRLQRRAAREATAAAGGVGVATGVLYNPRLDGTPFMVAGVFGFVLSFLTTLITAVTIVNERLSGTFDQLQVTPADLARDPARQADPAGRRSSPSTSRS